MTAKLGRRVEVATCIACGARNRIGQCADGCTDVPLDLVDAADVDALAARSEALTARANAFRKVLEAVAADRDWDALRERARTALRIDLPTPPEPTFVEAWGCPECGRVDAPQPCLDVCIRRPVLMTDAADYEALATQVTEREDHERGVAAVVRLIAYVTPRPGEEERTHTELRAAANAALGV